MSDIASRFGRRLQKRQQEKQTMKAGRFFLAHAKQALLDADHDSRLRNMTFGELADLGVIEWTSSDSLSKASCSQTGATQLSSGWPASLLALLS